VAEVHTGKTFPDRPKVSTAIVLHSGGIDSTTCLYLAADAFELENIVSLSIHYGQRHKKELDHAKMICDQLGVEHHVVKGIELPMSMITNPDVPIPSVSYKELGKGVSPTYVPFRNGNLLSQVAAIAMAQGVSAIYFGAHAEDAQNWAYPDCTPEFIGAMANAIYIGTYHKVRLITPLEWLTKRDIIALGTRLGVPWSLTWSCYKGEELHCGVCPTCRARQDGFTDANIHDPTTYRIPPLTEGEMPSD
jgi:7-cyano-7-deazaguanine synthase